MREDFRKMVIEQIDNCGRKEEIARRVLEALPDWFGLKESRETYIQESKTQYFFAAMDQNEIVGFLCLKETGKATLEISWPSCGEIPCSDMLKNSKLAVDFCASKARLKR